MLALRSIVSQTPRMGIFDRAPLAPQPPQENSKHHYFFAHYALRVAAFQHHLMMFPILTSPERADFFNTLLKTLDNHLQPEDGKRNFSGEDIRFAGFNIEGRPCAMVIMPPANNPAEAHFVAIVSRMKTEEMTWDVMNQEYEVPPIDYYTLELPALPDEDGRGVFCSWSHEEAHLNFGPGSRAEPEEFAEFLREKLSGR